MQLATTERTVDAYVLGPRGRYTMTPHQQRTYLAIVALARRHFPSPTLKEIVAHISSRGFGASNVHDDIRALEERGWLYQVKNKRGGSPHRNIRLIRPVLGNLKPVLAGTEKQ